MKRDLKPAGWAEAGLLISGLLGEEGNVLSREFLDATKAATSTSGLLATSASLPGGRGWAGRPREGRATTAFPYPASAPTRFHLLARSAVQSHLYLWARPVDGISACPFRASIGCSRRPFATIPASIRKRRGTRGVLLPVGRPCGAALGGGDRGGGSARLPLVLTALWGRGGGPGAGLRVSARPRATSAGTLGSDPQVALAAFQLLNLLGNVGLFLQLGPQHPGCDAGRPWSGPGLGEWGSGSGAGRRGKLGAAGGP